MSATWEVFVRCVQCGALERAVARAEHGGRVGFDLPPGWERRDGRQFDSGVHDDCPACVAKMLAAVKP